MLQLTEVLAYGGKQMSSCITKLCWPCCKASHPHLQAACGRHATWPALERRFSAPPAACCHAGAGIKSSSLVVHVNTGSSAEVASNRCTSQDLSSCCDGDPCSAALFSASFTCHTRPVAAGCWPWRPWPAAPVPGSLQPSAQCPAGTPGAAAASEAPERRSPVDSGSRRNGRWPWC